jgi:hypothetical protein
VQLVFTDALELEGLMDDVLARIDRPDGRTVADPTIDDEHRPILLAVSDNGPQMTSGSTREFMALNAIAVHFGRPGTPTDQAWIETFFGHLKAEFPHLLKITEPAVLRAELDHLQVHWNVVSRSVKTAKRAWNEPGAPGLPTTGRTGSMINSTTQKDPTMLSNTTRSCIANSETPQLSDGRTRRLDRRTRHHRERTRSQHEHRPTTHHAPGNQRGHPAYSSASTCRDRPRRHQPQCPQGQRPQNQRQQRRTEKTKQNNGQ